MNGWTFAIFALLLAPERIVYMVICRAPDMFVRRCRAILRYRADPVRFVALLFAGFKVLQLAVFIAWCVLHGDSVRPGGDAVVLAAGLSLVAAGQFLNLSVFRRLGRVGVFYGNHLGHDVGWRDGFPFSWFRHPQYVGVVVSIWGFFVVMRYPEPDWLVLPLLETLYYAVGAYVEQDPPTSSLP